MSQTIKIDQVLGGETFPLCLGQAFEIKPGIVVRLKDPTYALVEAFDKAGLTGDDDERGVYEAARDRVRLVVEAPDELDWGTVLTPMLYAVHDFFLRLSMRNTPGPGGSSAA